MNTKVPILSSIYAQRDMSFVRHGVSQSILRNHLIQHQFGQFATRRYASSANPTRNPWRTSAYATLFAVSAGAFTAYYFDARSALHRFVLMPVLRNAFDAETSHKIAVKILRSGFSPKDPVLDDERLQFQVCAPPLLQKLTLILHRFGVIECPIRLVSLQGLTKTVKLLTVRS